MQPAAAPCASQSSYHGGALQAWAPSALCRLPRLVSLDLNTNYFSPDVAVAGCKALPRLDLSVNFFGPIPESFGTFKKLESLSLVNNLLGGEVLAFLDGVATLRELNLSYNPFAQGPVPAELGGLVALRVLWLAASQSSYQLGAHGK